MIKILNGDSRQLIKDIPDKSVDLIFTDPPYSKEYIYLYEWLAIEGSRVIKDNGFVAMYVGIYWLTDVLKLVLDTNVLDYFMELIIFGSGYGPMMWNKRVIGKHKSIFLFRPKNGTGLPRFNIVSVFTGTGVDKRYHVWGQDEASARYYIDCLTKKGDMVLDPFCGGGTTPAMCKVLERNCLSYEIDSEVAKIARDRVEKQQMPLSVDLISTESTELYKDAERYGKYV